MENVSYVALSFLLKISCFWLSETDWSLFQVRQQLRQTETLVHDGDVAGSRADLGTQEAFEVRVVRRTVLHPGTALLVRSVCMIVPAWLP